MAHRTPALLLLVLWTGCVFDTTGLPGTGDDATPGRSDAAPAVDAVARSDARAPDAAPPPPPDAPPPFCPADSNLVGCYRFDGDGTDGSLSGIDAALTEVDWGSGVHGSAVVIDRDSVIRVADHVGLDAIALTLELWVRADELPENTARAGLIDNDGQYGLFIYAGGEVRCSCAGQLVSYSSIAVATWTHLACTYDPLIGMVLYVDGVERATAPGTGPPTTAVAGGLAIAGNSPSGDPLTGAIDDLRVWNRARSAGEVCAAAGSC